MVVRLVGLLTALVMMGAHALPLHAEAIQRKKVALVLSGGGAKGAAHIGAIKVIEEAGIPIDMVVGTSIGAIVGGMYAIGYTPHQLDSLARKLDWELLLSDRVKVMKRSMLEREHSERYLLSVPLHRSAPKVGGLIQGENLNSLFSELTVGYHGALDFDSLPRPFACVATEMQTGTEHVFRRGELATALRASMAFPGIFAPVRLDSLVLLDGGMSNNYPADIARQMGADIIIGVSVQERMRTGDNLNQLPEVLTQVMGFLSRKKLEENIALTDVFIHIDTHPYSTMSFSAEAVDSLLTIGRNTALRHLDALAAIREKVGIPAHERLKAPTPYASYASGARLKLSKVEFTGTSESEQQRLLHRTRLKAGDYASLSSIESAVALLRGEMAYSDVVYRLSPTGDGYALHFILQQRKEMNFNLGARFDTEEIASVMLNASLRFNTRLPSQLSLTGRVGKRYAARVDYRLMPHLLKHLNFSYQYYHGDCDVYEKSTRILNAKYNRHTAEASYSNAWWHNWRYDIGASFDAYTNIDLLTVPTATAAPRLTDAHFFSYFFALHYNSFDRSYFPTCGAQLNTRFEAVTDNLLSYRSHAPFVVLQSAWQGVLALSSHTALLPSIHGRAIFGEEYSSLYANVIGGPQADFLLPHQLPFDGITHVTYVPRGALVAGLKLRQRISSNHYATVGASFGFLAEHKEKFLRRAPIYGMSVGYALNSKLGPLQALVGFSPYTNKFNLFVNAGFYF